jgi:VWFA-related protein
MPARMLHPIRTSTAALALTLLPLYGQQPQVPPVFKTGTQVVLVDFIVSDKADKLVTGMTKADFVVKEDGKERPIVSFAAFAGTGAAPADGGAAAPAAGPSVSTVILVDDTHLTAQQTTRLRPDIKALLAKLGENNGAMFLLAPGSGVAEGRTLPMGAAALAGAVDQINGHLVEDHSDLPMSETEAIAIEHHDLAMTKRVLERIIAMNTMASEEQAAALMRNRATEVGAEATERRNLVYRIALEAFTWLTSQPGRHSIVLVSGGFANDPEDRNYNAIVTRSMRANAPIHFLDVRGLQGLSRFSDIGFGGALATSAGDAPLERSEAARGSGSLADDTGGITIRNANDLGKGLGRILDTMHTYYVLGYEAPPQSKPGFRKIKVETRTKGLNVRARRGYFDGF